MVQDATMVVHFEQISLRMGTGCECNGTNLHSPENIPRTDQSINGMPRSTSTARYLNIQTQTSTCESPMYTKKRILSKSCTSSFVALDDFGTD